MQGEKQDGAITVAHVLMPFSVPASTLVSVAGELSEAAAARGDRSIAVVSNNRDIEVRCAEHRFVDHTRHCPREYYTRTQTVVDVALGLAGGRRPFHGSVHRPSVEALRDDPPDLVLLYEGHYAATSLPWWAELRPRTKVVLYVHNPLSRTYRPRELGRLSAHCDAVVFCADHLRRASLGRLAGRVNIPVVTIPNGIASVFLENHDTARVGADSDEFELLFVGRTSENKGAHIMLEALAEVNGRVPGRVRAAVVGSSNYDGAVGLTDYEKRLRDIARVADLEVEFVRHVDRYEVVNRMRRASAICIPSIWSEGLPLVALEAMATMTPVVALDSAGVAEACGSTAHYARSRNPTDLADTIVAVVSDRAETERRALGGYIRSKEFTWTKAWAKIRELC